MFYLRLKYRRRELAQLRFINRIANLDTDTLCQTLFSKNKNIKKDSETDIIQLLEPLIDNILFFSTLSWLPFEYQLCSTRINVK
jgi:hypothetical protein